MEYRMGRRIFFLLILCLFVPVWLMAKVPEDSMKTLGLKEVQVFASYAGKKGTEPITQTNISKTYISARLGNQELPEIMKMTPSVYATKGGGGYGDSRIMLRGFASNNIAILINGVPVNGMENGSMYWSNWGALSDNIESIQIQRGLGISKLGVSSVGGTINILTESGQPRSGGSAFYGIGNDNYQHYGFSLSSGLKKGWAVTLKGSRILGDGYVNGTEFEAWSYYVNILKQINDRHLLSFVAFGAPQWHNRRGNMQYIEDYDKHRDGVKMNTSFGYINGKTVPTYSGYNEYHKPQISLNHFWTINDKSSLSTSVYISNAKGGGRKAYGKLADRIQYDYKTGRPKPTTDLTPEGYIDYTPVMEMNRNSETGSQAIFTMGTNAHDWYGLISTYNNDISSNFKFSAGIDGRYYKGYHYDKITDLLGGDYFSDTRLAWRDPETKLKVGDKVSSDYLTKIMWLGGFAQLRYETKNINTFISATVTDHMHRREDAGMYGIYAKDQVLFSEADRKTDWKSFIPISVKGGINYRFAHYNNIYINAGYVTRAPMVDNVYINNTTSSDLVNEKILTFETGYGFNLNNLSLSVTAYYTRWYDKSATKMLGNRKYAIPNIDAIHKGIEAEITYNPTPRWRLTGVFSLGDWRWANNAEVTHVKDDGSVEKHNVYIDKLHVGNAPQTSFAFSVDWEMFKDLYIGTDVNYYGRNYADFDPNKRTKSEDRADSWKMPDFCTVDANLNYKLKVGACDILFYGKINNLFNNKYISDATDGLSHKREDAMVWYGFGTTWTGGVKVSF